MKDTLVGEKDRKPWYNLLPCLESETLRGKFRESQLGNLTTLSNQKLIKKNDGTFYGMWRAANMQKKVKEIDEEDEPMFAGEVSVQNPQFQIP